MILRINSPGGSPVQAGNINDEIRRLRDKYPNIPLYAVVEDICASGRLLRRGRRRSDLRRQGEHRRLDRRVDGRFRLYRHHGKTRRRAQAADRRREQGIPRSVFADRTPRSRNMREKMLGEIHQQFIDVVRKGRGKRLKESPDMFSGLVWIGQKSIELGLADALGQRRLRGARSHQGRGNRRLHAAREHSRALCQALRRGDGRGASPYAGGRAAR